MTAAPEADFAHTAQAQRQRQRKAKTLARWCYARGLGPDVATAEEALLRAIARAAGVAPPPRRNGHSPTWDMVADLLRARAEWDHRHHIAAPESAHCAQCAVHGPYPPNAASQ